MWREGHSMEVLKQVFVARGISALVGYAPLLADPAPAPSPTQAPQERPSSPGDQSPVAQRASAAQSQTQTASGELVSVDVKAKTLTVKTATGEQKFSYNDSTTITGGKDVAGLATMNGSEVTVQFKKDGASNLATSISIKPSAGESRPQP